MSHQTGALIISSDFQTTELINWFKQATPVQIMYMQVPTFQARYQVRERTMLEDVKIYLQDAMGGGSCTARS